MAHWNQEKTMILVSGHFHHFRGPPCWIYRPSRATCFMVFKKIWKRILVQKQTKLRPKGWIYTHV